MEIETTAQQQSNLNMSIEQEAINVPQLAKADSTQVEPVKPLLVAQEVPDVIDTIIEEQNYFPMNRFVDQATFLILEDSKNLAYLRIGKLFNDVILKAKQLIKAIGSSTAASSSMLDKDLKFCEETQAVFRLLYVLRNVSNSEAIATTSTNIQIAIDKPFVKSLVPLLTSMEEVKELPIPVATCLRKLFIFSVNMPVPFVCTGDSSTAGDVFYNAIVNPLFEEMILNPSQGRFEVAMLIFFAHPVKMSKTLQTNLSQIQSQLESYLEAKVSDQADKDQKLIISITKLLVFAAINDTKVRARLFSSGLHFTLYEMIKRNVDFLGGETQNTNQMQPSKEQFSNLQRLIQVVIVLIKVVLSHSQKLEKKFQQALLNDLLFLIEKKSFGFIVNGILPILATSDVEYIPVCLHKKFAHYQATQFNTYLKEANLDQSGQQIICDLNSKVLTSSETSQLFQILKKQSLYDTDQATKGKWVEENELKNSMIYSNSASKHTMFIFRLNEKGNINSKLIVFMKKKEASKQAGYHHVKHLRYSVQQNYKFIEKCVYQCTYFKSNGDTVELLQGSFTNTSNDYAITYQSDMTSFYIDGQQIISVDGFNHVAQWLDTQANTQIKFTNGLVKVNDFQIWYNQEVDDESKADGRLIGDCLEKTNLQSLILEQLQYYREEQVTLIPSFNTLKHCADHFIRPIQESSEISISFMCGDETVAGMVTMKELNSTQNETKANKIIDLTVVGELNLLDLPFAKDVSSIYPLTCTEKLSVATEFNDSIEGLVKVLQFLDNVASQKDSQIELSVFFYKALQMLRIKGVSAYLINQPQFFQYLFHLLYDSTCVAGTVLGMKYFHSATLCLVKAVRQGIQFTQLLSMNVSVLADNFFVLRNILEIFESYNGRKVTAINDNAASAAPESALTTSHPTHHTGSSSQTFSATGLAKRGVGYGGSGSSDTSWVNSYSGMIGGDMSSSDGASSGGMSGLYSNKAAKGVTLKQQKKQQRFQDQFNAYSAIQMYLDPELTASLSHELMTCLEHLFSPDNISLDLDLYNKIADSSLHETISYFIQQKNFVGESGPVNRLVALLQLFKNIVRIRGLEHFFVKSISDKDAELGKNNCFYSKIDIIQKQLLFFKQNASSIVQMSGASKQVKGHLNKIKSGVTSTHEMLASIEYIQRQLEATGYLDIKEEIVETKMSNSKNGQLDFGSLRNELDNLSQFMPIILQPKCVTRSPSVSINHHYKNQFSTLQGHVPSPIQVQRMVQEISGLQNSLEARPSSAIFVCQDEEKMNVMRSLIFGAEGTPYAHGAFVFDIFLPTTYPQVSPQMNLSTTGSGKIRFNPNLYHCGKVCLSLLGTWRGVASESWNPKISSILQLLISVQAIVMSEYVYFNEPGYEGHAGTPEGEKANVGYSNIVRLGNIRHAMIDQIRDPLPEFKEIILTSFYLKQSMILKECKSWLEKVKEPAVYTGLVNSHNQSFCAEISKVGYEKLLRESISDLEKEFDGLKLKMKSLSFGSMSKTTFDSKSNTAVEKKYTVIVKHSRQSRLIEGDPANNKLPQVSESGQQMSKIPMDAEPEALDQLINSFQREEIQKQSSNSNKSTSFGDLNAGVKDRWSRYIGVLGLDSVQKQSEASVLIVGLDHVGVEIAKNIALSGVKLLGLADSRKLRKVNSVLGQFFLNEANESSSITVAEATLTKIQALNEYVNCCVDTDVVGDAKAVKRYSAVVVVNQSQSLNVKISRICRINNIAFVAVDSRSVYARVMTDFGATFTVLDQNGEPAQEYTVGGMVREKHAQNTDLMIVKLVKGLRHNFDKGTVVSLREVVEGHIAANGQLSLNGREFVVEKRIDSTSFAILVSSSTAEYVRNGIVSEVKQPLKMKFTDYETQLVRPLFDENMNGGVSNDLRMALHIAFNSVELFISKFDRLPGAWNEKDAENFYNIAINQNPELLQYFADNDETKWSILRQTLIAFSLTAQGYVPAQGSVLGGIVAQEIIKSITKKWKPVEQVLVYSCDEILAIKPQQIAKFILLTKLQGFPTTQAAIQLTIENRLFLLVQHLGLEPVNNKYDPIRMIVGAVAADKIANVSAFVIGAGAIGCEVIKNLAMNGFSREGKAIVTVTDPDVIENSNLSRQFLFRTQHINKPKSSVSAAAAVHMNRDLQGHIHARLLKVCDGTENVFNDSFFEKQGVVLNALDNVQARVYVDRRCVETKVPMVDSGTLGSKGHVQVVLPFLTESYGNQVDPNDEGGDIPQCTLKMFPENSIHCMEWAKDKFGRLFEQKPASLARVYDAYSSGELHLVDEKVLREGLSCLMKLPKSYSDCVEYAVKKFNKLFKVKIQELLHVYPLKHMNADGTHFWTLPKRPPVELEFDPQNKMHRAFVLSLAKIRADVFKIAHERDTHSEEAVLESVLRCVKLDSFKVDEAKVKEIKDMHAKEEMKKQGKEQMEIEVPPSSDFQKSKQTIMKEVDAILKAKQSRIVNPIAFEKDVDANRHVDLMHAMTNCRGANYKLSPMEWMDVKIKAGRITPALVTTTAIVAGLQVIEAMKIVMKAGGVAVMKNSFVNISLPHFVQSEPLEAPVTKLTSDVKVTIWDRWNVSITDQTCTLGRLYRYLQEKYKLYPRDLIQGMKPIYLESMSTMNMSGQDAEMQKQRIMDTKLVDLVTLKRDGDRHVDIIITFTESKNSNTMIDGVPAIRLHF